MLSKSKRGGKILKIVTQYPPPDSRYTDLAAQKKLPSQQ